MNSVCKVTANGGSVRYFLLARDGTEHLRNVCALPCRKDGWYIIAICKQETYTLFK